MQIMGLAGATETWAREAWAVRAEESRAGLGWALVRRWYVVVAGLVVTGCLVAAVAQLVPPQYEATAHILLYAPQTSATPDGNPLLNLGGLEPAVAILTRAMSDDSTMEALKAEGAKGEFTVEADPLTSAPVLLVTVDATSSAAALDTLDLVVERVDTTFVNVQNAIGATGKSLINQRVLTRDQRATLVRKTQIRVLLVTIVGGLIMTVLAAAGTDALLAARAARRRSRRASAPPPAAPGSILPNIATSSEDGASQPSGSAAAASWNS